MAGPLARVLLGPDPPETVLGRPLPRSLRGWRLHLTDPATVLRHVAAWAERELAEQRPPPPGGGDRDTLIRTCIEVRDLARGEGLRRKLADALAAVGVTEIVPDGEPFDPQLHRAVDRVATGDPDRDGCIASTEVPGYRDRERTIRTPEVTVYRLEDGRGR